MAVELITATSSSNSSLTVSLTLEWSLSAAAQAISAIQGNLLRLKLCSGTSSVTSLMAGYLIVEKALIATPAVTSTVSGKLVMGSGLSATVFATSLTEALLRVLLEFTTTTSTVSTTIAQLLLLTTNPADLIWHLLVTHGELDNIQSSANVDIGYDVWEKYREDCGAPAIALKAELTGTLSIGGILEKVAYLAKSTIFVRGDGKFVFYRLVPAPPVHYTFDDDNSHNIRVEQKTDEIINYVKCYYGYDPATGDWAGSVIAEDAASQRAFGIVPRIEEDRTVWHATQASAQEFCNWLVERFKDPRQYCSFDTGLVGFVFEPEDIFSNSIAFYDYIFTTFETKKAEFDLNSGKAKIEALNVTGFVLGGFRLDDNFWGLLDRDYNVLY